MKFITLFCEVSEELLTGVTVDNRSFFSEEEASRETASVPSFWQSDDLG